MVRHRFRSAIVVSFLVLGSVHCVAHPLVQSQTSGSEANNADALALLGLDLLSAEIIPVTDSLLVSLRSDRGVTIAGDGTMISWENSVNAQKATITGLGNTPTFLTSDPVLNGRPSVVFSGGAMEYLNLTLSDTVTYFVAFRNSLTGVTVVMEHGDDANFVNGGGMYLSGSNSDTVAFRRGTGGFATTMSALDYLADWSATNTSIVATGQYAGSNASHIFRFNGTAPTVTNPLTNDPTGSQTASLYFGGRGRPPDGMNFYYMDGAIAEILIYDRALSLSEIEAVETYLMKRY